MTIQKNDSDPLGPIVLTHTSSGANATIYPFGATVTSYKTCSGRELLFVSRTAKLDGSKAIRGGIPLVFPQFGRPDQSMPQHGFLRCNLWKVESTYEEGDDACSCVDLSLSLKDVVAARGGEWNVGTERDCTVTLTVKVYPSSFTTTMTVVNSGGVAFPYQALFHTYYAISGQSALNGEVCNVKGLAGYEYLDQLTAKSHVQNDEPITIGGEVDRIYSHPTQTDIDVVISTGVGTSVALKSSAFVTKLNGDNVVAPVGVVVWNPFIEKAKSMGDFDDEQYKEMICVEPGMLKDVPIVEKGDQFHFSQTITSCDDDSEKVKEVEGEDHIGKKNKVGKE
eukprot:CAMPEP_0194367062 /NCGR_PEP_ID=MMETSP0174-20130528/15169_1 /TAXON_ID=216777 /ORGANISM="Proboscia alata, Strain PI-D3" /LENGTH=336 /DNA_ID=CAMNT_0039142629 /DNA_START=28 /DNA_END=1038 /DNA_ORIENTATION=-